MSREAVEESQVQALRAVLPTHGSVRDDATRAVARVAKEIGLELRPADARALALAAVERTEKAVELRGIDFAFGIVEGEVTDARKYLIEPRAEQAAVDPEAAARLEVHRQFVSGMDQIHVRLRRVLIGVAHRWLGLTVPPIEAPPVVPLRGPAGAGDARGRAAVRAGAA